MSLLKLGPESTQRSREKVVTQPGNATLLISSQHCWLKTIITLYYIIYSFIYTQHFTSFSFSDIRQLKIDTSHFPVFFVKMKKERGVNAAQICGFDFFFFVMSRVSDSLRSKREKIRVFTQQGRIG